ncbi:hypothetical protein C8Q72DRAFT_758816, partial [Fomitopsis betulina]
CAFCHKRMLAHDLERHLRTHVKSKSAAAVCTGVPWSQKPDDGVERDVHRLPHTGEVHVGGCGRVFNRKDSYTRHITGDTSKCLQGAGVHCST